jgi:flavin-binding protein dodecin
LGTAKTSDLVASSPRGWEDAIRVGVARASQTLAGLKEVEVTQLTAKIEHGMITEYRAHLTISFILDSDYPLHE